MLFIAETRSYLLIGGYDGDDDLSQIAKFQGGVWSDAGQLNSARRVCFCLFCLFINHLSNFKLHSAQWLGTHLLSRVEWNHRRSLAQLMTSRESSTVWL